MVNVINTLDASGSIIGGIVADYQWDTAALTFGFRKQDIDNNGKNDFDEGNWRKFYETIFDDAANITKLTFAETSFEKATLNQLLENGGGGQSSNPYPRLAEDMGGLAQTYTQVGIIGPVENTSNIVIMGRFSDVWFHEIGHSLGLTHTFERPNLIDSNVYNEYNIGDHFLNSMLYSVMSYSPNLWGEDNPWTMANDPGVTLLNASTGSFMPIDVAALQHMYGRSEAATGNDTYTFSDNLVTNAGYRTIWDTGGIDTLRYEGDSAAKIDLHAATLRQEIGGGGFLSTSETLTGGFLIANGVTIENATGNRADDILIGNAAANTLTGLGGKDILRGDGGDDRLDGGAGDDTLDGGEGKDSAIYQGAFKTYSLRFEGAITVVTGEGIDRLENVEGAIFSDGVYDLGQRVFKPTATTVSPTILTGTEQDDTLTATNGASWTLKGQGGNDMLVGSTGKDRLDGGTGNDRLDGGAGADTMIGGKGDDTYVVDNKGDVVVEAGNGGHDTVESSISYALGAWVQDLTLTGSAALTGTGNELDNTLIGNDAANSLIGGAGDDWLDGRGGRDEMKGGLGDDYYVVDNLGDVVIERAGEGTDHVETTLSHTLGAHVENLYLQGIQTVDGTGNNLSNILVGNQAANVLAGHGGDDHLYGGAGDDHLNGGAGVDELTGGAGNDTFQFYDNETGSDGNRADTILDFQKGDVIDLSEFGLHFIGQAAFGGAGGDIRFTQGDGETLIEGDIDGDARADIAINLVGLHNLTANDFLL